MSVDPTFIMEFGFVCLFGEHVEHGRDDGRVLPGATSVELHAEVDPTFTGLQVGHSVDDGPVTWFPVVVAGSETFTVPVTPDQWEEPGARTRWTFYHRMTEPLETHDCYNGGGVGAWSLVAEAIRG